MRGRSLLAPTLLDTTRAGRQAEDLENRLRSLVVGQEEAVQGIVRTWQTYLTGMSPAGRPIGNFLFLGPTGTGKTRIVEATAESLLKNPRAVIKIDCGEFQHSHEIAKLVGSPPGYLGHRETHGLLSQEALNQYHTERKRLSLVLFDEIEKASDAFWNLLLGVLDKAVLTLGDNRRVDFSSTMIFMTSNLGAAEMSSLIAPRLGFRVAAEPDVTGEKLTARRARAGVEAARRKFTPEFMNRLDHVVVFQSLGANELRRIVDIEIEAVCQRIEAAALVRPLFLNITDAAREFLLVEGTDFKYGARHLKRAIERLVVQPMSNLMATGQIHRGDCITVTHSGGSDALTFYRDTEAFDAWQVGRRVAA